MRELLKTYFKFWSQFCTAYPSGNVSSETTFPYLTYPTPRPKWGGRITDNIILYDQSTSYDRIGAILEVMEEIITEPGITLNLGDGSGSITLYRPDGNFFQLYALPADEIKENIKAYVITIEYLGHIY